MERNTSVGHTHTNCTKLQHSEYSTHRSLMNMHITYNNAQLSIRPRNA